MISAALGRTGHNSPSGSAIDRVEAKRLGAHRSTAIAEGRVAQERREWDTVENLADEARWRAFIALTTGQPPWPRLIRAAGMFERPGEALDVGAGAGRDTAYLLQNGWRVTALDSSPSAAEALRRLAQPNLRVVVEAVQEFVPSHYDLVNAQFSLPFIPPEQFDATVRRVRDSVREGGVMTATFFGKHDAWNVPERNLSFSTQADVERLFSGWDVVELTEVEENGHTADGSPKHWHVFHLIARRPAH